MIQTVSNGRLVGYARVSTDDQNLTLQIDSLIARTEIDKARVFAAQKLQADHMLSIDQICETLRISRSTYYRYLRLNGRSGPAAGN